MASIFDFRKDFIIDRKIIGSLVDTDLASEFVKNQTFYLMVSLTQDLDSLFYTYTANQNVCSMTKKCWQFVNG
jgi:hypothetical protein